MFLIVPKSKNNTLRVSQPVARLKGAARVHAACSRCRLKKVKCDNRMPCIRCAQDGVLCVETKKAPADAKAASIEYIRKMEDQQSQLLKALTAVSKHVRQPVDGEDLKEILDIVEKGGFAFETVGEHPTIARTTTSNVRNKRRNDDQVNEGDSISPTRKRKQGCGKGISPLGNGNPHSTSANISTSFGQNIPPHYQPNPDPIDNYWEMDGYGDKVAAPFKHPLTDTYPAISPSTQQNRIAPSQDIWVPGNRICDSISQSTYPTAPTTCPPVASLDPTQDTEPLFSSLNHFDSTDWNSVLWWDPSLLFEPNFDAESQGSNASEFPNTL